MRATTRLSAALRAGHRLLTAECLPPRGASREAVEKLAGCFPAVVHGVLVVDGMREARGSAWACAAVLAAAGREPLLSLSTRDRNRIALESDVMGASTLGITSYLCTTGSHQALGHSPRAAGANDIDAIQLLQALRRMARDGVDFAGKELDAPLELLLAARAHPELLPLGLNLLTLEKKVDAGAQLLLTDAVFDVPAFERWMKAVRAAGLHEKAAVLAGIQPLESAAQAEQIVERRPEALDGRFVERLRTASDPVEEGIRFATEIARELSHVPGLRGFHLLSAGCEPAVRRLIDEAPLA